MIVAPCSSHEHVINIVSKEKKGLSSASLKFRLYKVKSFSPSRSFQFSLWGVVAIALRSCSDCLVPLHQTSTRNSVHLKSVSYKSVLCMRKSRPASEETSRLRNTVFLSSPWSSLPSSLSLSSSSSSFFLYFPFLFFLSLFYGEWRGRGGGRGMLKRWDGYVRMDGGDEGKVAESCSALPTSASIVPSNDRRLRCIVPLSPRFVFNQPPVST